MVKDLQMLFQMNTEANEKWCVRVRWSGKTLAGLLSETQTLLFFQTFFTVRLISWWKDLVDDFSRQKSLVRLCELEKWSFSNLWLTPMWRLKDNLWEEGSTPPAWDAESNPGPEKKVFTAEPESGLDVRDEITYGLVHWRVFNLRVFPG